jgi:glycerophosphoryl diester phosphodiesterase
MLKSATVTFLIGVVFVTLFEAQRSGPAKVLIAHRGASGYAPEHTMAAYQMALDQHADFVEPDLAVSRDGALICLHDDTLERTTNVEAIFPDRYSRETTGRTGRKQWVANDFTTAEIKRLDAGSWMDAKYAGARVPTFEEMVTLVRGKAGLYPELKSPPLYTGRGVDMVQIFVESVKAQKLDTPESLTITPVVIQSFDWPTVERVARELPTIPRVFLTSDDADVTDARLKALSAFATGIAPDKAVIARHPDMVARAHALGLTVTAWTFRADQKTGYPSVREEMAQYLYTWGIDALFTNHPDQFPRR